MDKIYNFDWLVKDIDNTMIFMLRNGSGELGSYQIQEIVTGVVDPINVKFANISDLTAFINYATVRFVDALNNDNFVDIPIRKIKDLYNSSNEITEGIPKDISLNELDAFAIYNGRVVKDGYSIVPYKINVLSSEDNKELMDTITIANEFSNLSMNEKIEALEEINLINYRRSIKSSDSKSRKSA